MKQPHITLVPTPELRAGVSGWSKRRGARFLLLALIFITFTLGFFLYEHRHHTPLYWQFHEAESHLPQHNHSLAFPEGRDAKFLYFARTAKDHEGGFGNIMQETLLNAYLAHQSKRAYVFDHHLWSDSGGGYSTLWDQVEPMQIPFTAMLAGSIVGGPMPEGSLVPRAVHTEYFHEVCPPEEQVHLSGHDVLEGTRRATAQQLIQAWVAKLDSVDARCVVIDKWVFRWGIFTHADRLLSIWDDFKASPVMTTLDYSPLMRSAFDHNRHVFDSNHPVSALEHGSSQMINGLLVMHIRRGDFKKLCTDFLPGRRWPFMAYSSFPEFPDAFTPPSRYHEDENAQLIYMERCWPRMDQMINHVREVLRDNGDLRSVYVMTNAPRPWIKRFKERLHSIHKWDLISTSRDLKLNTEQQYIAQVVDMMIAERSQVFIGNGFSSLTSNINMLRMRDGLPPASNRFW